MDIKNLFKQYMYSENVSNLKPYILFTHRTERLKMQLSNIKPIYFILSQDPEIFISQNN